MPKQIIITEQHHIAAVFWEDQIQELVVATGNQQVSDIFLGVVENIIPGIDAAFVNIGDAERNGFIHVTDLGPLRLKRSAGGIIELLTPQQKVLVQVMKEPTGNKGPRLTGNVSLPGRYLVLMPNGKGVNLSRRICNDDERSRLRALAILIKPAGMGLLVRTEAEGKAEEAIMEDLEFLQRQWESVQVQATSTRAPSLLNRDDDFIQRVLRDIYSADVNRIVVDSTSGVKRVKHHLMNWSSGRPPEGVLIDHHQESLQILDYFRVNAAIREALKPRVDLPSGGYIIIEPTEALTVVDVNSGSFTRSATSRETVLWTNSEAATEIARQLRLRNIGGVIIVDFIDMDSRRDQLKLLEHFNNALKEDKARPQIAQLSELGLVELTRKRQGKNIYELFGQPCSSCGGLGHLASLPGEPQLVPLELASSSASQSFFNKPTESNEQSLESSYEDDNSSELELLFHPSYQEQNGNTTNNRRRRRRQSPNLVVKEDPVAKIVNNLSNKEVEDDNEPILESRREPLPRHLVREENTIEKVSVEMTSLEQDIYALMGISPLVRLDRKFKDPKSVLVTVKLPEENKIKSSLKSQKTTFKSLDKSTKLSEKVSEDQITIDLSQANNLLMMESLNDDDIDTLQADGNKPLIRRRRRRSSAKDIENIDY
ncbi:Rne/Rng family ribonuclease [Candidatus Atelocyanobacterium thalassae]|uniref:Ribonuclease E n=1 Tax=cyanobacterium endosymbiont of Braarudosphaera bigelowii TaxID=1285375 RepID=A0ABN6JYP1_9CHRO|nr:Rne/Rng family ribonuclease [Candidatus Atelocyanobacterium thalassa]BDA39492.1 ribonuclease E [cyanobacterium endosymbiont of Braarudosphaera bigelowii]